MSDNIVLFPRQKRNCPPTTLEEITQKVATVQERLSHEVSEVVWRNTIDQLQTSGVDVEERYEEFAAITLMLLETIKALHLASTGHYHPLQDYAEANYREEANMALAMIEEEEAAYED